MRSSQLLGFVAGAATAVSAQTAYYSPQPSPMPCYGDACVDPTYDNLRYQDNTIIRRPGKNGASDIYFRFSKGDHPGDGINVATSDSLSGQWYHRTGPRSDYILNKVRHLNFTILGQLSDISKSDCVSGTYKSQNFANSDLNRWAPEVHFINNQYYLFYTVEDQKNGYCFDQCVATSPSMDAGTWTDHGTMNLPNRNFAQWRRIDGNILSDASDPQGVVSPYMAFNSFGYGIYGIELNSDYLTAKNVEPKLLIKSQDQPGGNRTEGAFQLRHNGYIYLFYSRGSCCSGGDADPQSVYRTQVCRTSANTPAGPYYDRDNVSCSDGPTSRAGSTILYPVTHNWEPGSVSVLLDPKEGLIMTYQYVDTTRQSPGPFLGWGWNYLTWQSDGWPKLTQTRT